MIGRCLYGVDMNPMAAELCRVSLWLEALEPGRPLSFLEHHIRVGNSLLGATPELIAAGLPDNAFTAIEGDDKKACAVLKKRNKGERKGWGPMFAQQDAEIQACLQRAAAALEELPDGRPEDIRAKEVAFRCHEQTEEYQQKKKLADAWCAAFVVHKHFREPGRESSVSGLTQGHLNDLATGGPLPAELAAQTEHLSDQYQFFHWHLAFPEVFAEGGFDCVLGNPPWDQLQIDPREFFASASPDIALAETTAKRNRLISLLKNHDPTLNQAWKEEVRRFEGIQTLIHGGGGFPLGSVGRLNSAPLFTELSLKLVCRHGRIGLVAPSGIATDSFCQYLFGRMVESGALVSLFDFENRAGLFPAVHSSMKFSLLTCGSPLASVSRAARFAFFAHQVEDLLKPDRCFSLRPEEIELLNPNTKTCSVFRTVRDAELAKTVYRRVPILQLESGDEGTDLWGFVSRLLVMSNTDSDLFKKQEDLAGEGFTQLGPLMSRDEEAYIPLYEAKMFQLFDHRASDVIISDKALKRQAQPSEISSEEHRNPMRFPKPRFWISATDTDAAFAAYTRSWYIAVTKVTSATNTRTLVAGLLPRFPSTDSSFAMLLTSASATSVASACFYANVCSFVFDYIARQKLGGVNMLGFIQKQLPMLPPAIYDRLCSWSDAKQALGDWLGPRVLELTYTAWDLEPFAQDCGWSGPPFRWDEERRFLLRCELDASFFHLYLPAQANGDWHPAEGETAEDLARLKTSFPTPRDAVAYIMDTFPIVKRKDIEKHGDYRTKLVILDIYDRMLHAIATGQPYQTLLDPPPADAHCCHPPRQGRQ